MTIDEFIKIEDRFKLYNESINEFKYWFYIRGDIYGLINDHSAKGVEVHSHNGLTYWGMIKALFCSFLHNISIKKSGKSADIFVVACSRRIRREDVFFAIYTDELVGRLGSRTINVEFPFKGAHLQPSYTPNLIWLDYVEIIPKISRKIRKILKNNGLINLFKNKAQYIADVFEQNSDAIIDVSELEQKLENLYYIYQCEKKLLSRLLIKYSPKVVIYEEYYNLHKMILNEVARPLGIVTMELQHGINEEFVCYDFKDDLYADCLPQKFLAFSDYWKKKCNLPIGENNIIATGFPYHDEEMRKFPPQKKLGLLTIIVLSTDAATNSLIEFMEDFMKILNKSGRKARILYKLHPLEYNMAEEQKERIRNLGETVTLIDTPDIPLYSLFAISDIQLGVFSTSIYEGTSYGLDTYIIDMVNASEKMKSLVEMRQAKVVNSPAELAEYIGGYTRKTDAMINECFFMQHAIKNILSVIESV